MRPCWTYYKLEGGPVVTAHDAPKPPEEPHLCIRGILLPLHYHPVHYVGGVWIDKNGVDDHTITPKNWEKIIKGMRTHQDLRDFASALFETLGMHEEQVKNLVGLLTDEAAPVHEIPSIPAHFKKNGTAFTYTPEGYTLVQQETTYEFDEYVRLTKENSTPTPRKQFHDENWCAQQRQELTKILQEILAEPQGI